jgi:pyruvate/2-oxoglutarate dehydrogenase complex dihydrolipoamide acyltransferase (E2) component
MKSLFSVGFTQEPWRPTLGISLEELLQTGTSIYQAYERGETAEDQRRAAEAEAAAARAQAAAAQAATAQAAAPGAAAEGPKILGIPRDYVIVGGIGLAAIAAIVALVI